MTTLREAAQQALEALEYYQHRRLEWDYSDEVAINALKAALAEPVQEPVCAHGVGKTKCSFCSVEDKQPVQEPVAGRAFLERILAAIEGVIDIADRKTDEFDALRSCVIDLTLMLHTAPPQRTLTDEVIADLWHQNGGFHHHFARAIERWLRGHA